MKNIHELNYEITGQEWQTAINNAWTKVSKSVKIDGFREGKVPRNVYEEKYGKIALYKEAVDSSLNEVYVKLLTESKLEPVIAPTVDIMDVTDEKATIKFTVTTAPEVEIKSYKNLGVKMDSTEVTEEELNTEIDKILTQYAELVVKEGKVESGDTAIIDYEGKKDGVAFEGGTASNHELKIGSNSFIPGFEDGVIGMSVGEVKDIELTFPEEYHSEELKGAKVVFTVTLNEVKTEVKPELNEEFFMDLGMDDVKNEEQLRSFIKENLELKKKSEVENKFIDEVIKAISKDMKVEIPTGMIDEEVNRIMDEFKERLQLQHLNIEDYYKWTGGSEEVLRTTVEPEAKSRVESRLILNEIIKLENLTASSEEIEKRTEELAIHYNMTKEELTKQFGDKNILEYEVKIKKAIEVLKENNK